MIEEIRASAKVSFKQPTKSGDVFYTFEYGETRKDNFESQEAYEEAKNILWNQVNDEVTKQILQTKALYKGDRNC